MKKVLLTLMLSFLAIWVSAQVDSSIQLNRDSLNHSLKAFYQKKCEAEMAEFIYAHKYKFLRFIPSFGWSFSGPLLGYNTTDLFNSLNLNRAKKAKLEGIKKQNELEYNESLLVVTRDLNNLAHLIMMYESGKIILEMETELFKIIESSYKNADIKPTEYWGKKIHLENIKLQREQTLFSIIELRNKIIVKAKKTDFVGLF